MSRDTVFVDFKVGDTSEIEAKATQLNAAEEKAFADGNKELENRAALLKKSNEALIAQNKSLQQGLSQAKETNLQLSQQADAISKANQALIEQQKAAKAVADVSTQQTTNSNTQAQSIANNITELGKELQVQKNINTAFEKQFVSAKTIGDQIIALGNVFDAAFQTGGVESLEAVFNELDTQLKGTGLTAEQFITQLQQADPATQLVTESTAKFSTQLQEVKNQMYALVAAGEINSKQYQDLEAKAIQYQQAIETVNSSVKTNVKTSQGLAQAADVLGTVNSAAQVVVGTYSLFSTNNKELTKALTTLNAVMLITNGIQSISVALKKSDSVVTRLLTVAQNAFTTALYGTTVGLTAVQTAIAATGIGVLVIALGLAINELLKFVSSLTDATDAIKSFDDSIKFLNLSLDAQQQSIKNTSAIAIEQAKRQKDSFEDLHALQMKEIDDLLAAQKTHTKLVGHQLDLLKDKTSDTYKAISKDHDGYLKTLAETELEEKKSKEAEINLIQQSALTQEQYLTKSYERRKDALDKYSKESNEIYNRTAEYQIDRENKLTQDTNNVYAVRIGALETSNKLRLSLIEKQRKQELTEAAKSATTTNETLLNINDKYNVARENADNEYFQKKKELTRQHEQENAIAELTIQQNVIKQRLSVAQRGSKEEFELQNDLLRAQADQQKEAINFSVKNEKLKAAQLAVVDVELNERLLNNQEAYNKERLRNATETQQHINDLAISRLQESVIGKDSNSNDVFEEQQKERQIILQETYDTMARLDFAFQSGQIKDEEQYTRDRNKLETEAANKRVDILKAEAERRKKINDAIRDAAFDIAQNLSDAIFSANDEKRKAQLDTQMEQLDKARQNELDNENLTEQQKEQINERFDAKERQLKRRAAEQDKDASIAQASINAALAITKAFATLPWPFNLIQAAAVAITTGIQIQKIKSTPLPAYEKGTNYAKRGDSIVGEKGPEIRYNQGGEIILTHTETQRVLQYANTREVVNATIERAINRNYVNEMTAPNTSIDYDKLAEKVGKQFKRYGMKVETNFDNEGMGQYIHNSGIKTQYLNKRYKL